VSRISKAVREEAIEALLCCADDYLTGNDGVDAADERAKNLTDSALHAVWAATQHRLHIGDDHLEAAALLIDGWSPGDPVEVRS
jgi:hypothetical protein